MLKTSRFLMVGIDKDFTMKKTNSNCSRYSVCAISHSSTPTFALSSIFDCIFNIHILRESSLWRLAPRVQGNLKEDNDGNNLLGAEKQQELQI
ncbi:hypothetical protein IFM89_033812 [Coptis chinensis]|uniref:Uncharacterized protein n=1 Tax=Coptis chinensis TaxID=261450 RepID=A0A835HRR5_9MAGN|nr:hypothetical protein IFM89_033812 [Coptis chinensis]